MLRKYLTMYTIEFTHVCSAKYLIAYVSRNRRSDAFEPKNASQEVIQRSPKTSEEEAWQTLDDMGINYSTRPDQERRIHKCVCDKCHQRTRVDVP